MRNRDFPQTPLPPFWVDGGSRANCRAARDSSRNVHILQQTDVLWPRTTAARSPGIDQHARGGEHRHERTPSQEAHSQPTCHHQERYDHRSHMRRVAGKKREAERVRIGVRGVEPGDEQLFAIREVHGHRGAECKGRNPRPCAERNGGIHPRELRETHNRAGDIQTRPDGQVSRGMKGVPHSIRIVVGEPFPQWSGATHDSTRACDWGTSRIERATLVRDDPPISASDATVVRGAERRAYPMDSLRNIIVGLDFTSASKEALDQAARIAAWNGATLYVMHVVDSSILDSVLGLVGLGTDQSWNGIQEQARALAEKVAAEGRLTDGARVDVCIGSPIERLVHSVRAHAADLLVLGVRNAGSGGRGPGPVATACLRHAPTEVLLVREGHTGPYKSIVACTDFSGTSYLAVQMAVRVAQRDKSALRIMHVAMPPRMDMAYAGNPLGFWPGQPLKVMDMWNHYRSSLEPTMEKFVEPLRNEMSALNVTLDISEHEHYGRGIAAYVKEHKADLLVLGNQGKTNLRYALLGSTAERALAELPCSVLVVKPAVIAAAPTESSAVERSQGRWAM